MFLNGIILSVLAFFAGVGVSAGTFAFLLVIGVVPRMLRTTNLIDRIITIETTISLGVIAGNIMSLWSRAPGQPDGEWSWWIAGIQLGISYLGDGAWVGHILLGVYGIAAGIFVGCIAVALAEILDTFPIMFRRFNIRDRGTGNNMEKHTPRVEWMMFAMAFGKLIGSLFFFVGGYH